MSGILIKANLWFKMKPLHSILLENNTSSEYRVERKYMSNLFDILVDPPGNNLYEI